MKKNVWILLLFIFLGFNISSGYPQDAPASKENLIKAYDINKDGKADVVYYGDDKYVKRAEADTNYDGRPDVIVHTKDGKFDSAEVDTDYDGKTDKKFSNEKAFNKWLNEKHPDLNDRLNKADWQFNLKEF